MKIHKFHVGKLFFNNKIVVIVSVFLAFALWIKVSTDSSETMSLLISDIPITVNLSDSARESGLSVFGGKNATAQVSVTGNRLIMGQLSPGDILVTAPQSTNIINTPGTYTLELVAKKNSLLSAYDFSSNVSPTFITILVDRVKSAEIEIRENIKYSSDPIYFVNPVALSTHTVTVSGPESQVVNVSRAEAIGEISGVVDKTTTLNSLPITLFDANGNRINTANMTLSVSRVDATIQVLDRKILPIIPRFNSAPEELPFNNKQVKIEPSSIEIAGPRDALTSLGHIELSPVDFSKINLKNNQFELPITIPTGCRNLSNRDSVILRLDTSGITSRSIPVKRFTFVGLGPGKIAVCHTVRINVDVFGPATQVRALSSENVSAQVDLKGREEFIGRTEMPVRIVFDSAPACWSYGQYKVNVGVIKNE